MVELHVEQAEVQLLRRVYAAFNRREIDVVLAEMHDNVDWPKCAAVHPHECRGGEVLWHQRLMIGMPLDAVAISLAKGFAGFDLARDAAGRLVK